MASNKLASTEVQDESSLNRRGDFLLQPITSILIKWQHVDQLCGKTIRNDIR